MGWRGIAPQIWAVILLVIASGLGIFFGYWRHNLAYALVVVWALVGIGGEQQPAPLVAYAAWGLAAVVLVAALSELRWSHQKLE